MIIHQFIKLQNYLLFNFQCKKKTQVENRKSLSSFTNQIHLWTKTTYQQKMVISHLSGARKWNRYESWSRLDVPLYEQGGKLNCWIVVPEDTTLSHYCLIYSPSSSSPRRHSVRCSKSRPQHTTALLAVTFVKQVFLFDLSQDVCLLRCRLSGGNIFQSEPNWKHLSIFVLFWIGDNGWRLSKRVVWSTNYLVWLSVVWLTKTSWIFFTH